MDLTGKVAVITGASRGIGAGLAECLAARGFKLGLCARSPCQLPAGAEGLCAQLDVADPSALRGFAAEIAETLGPIALWINNAGVLSPIAPLRDIDPVAFLDHLRVNVMGVVHGCQAYVAHLRARAEAEADAEPGVLVNISSGAAWQGYAGWAPYCASKAAVERISEALQIEEGERVRVLALAPGIIDTDMQALIRSCSEEQFPSVEYFRERKAQNDFHTIPHVAEHLLRFAFDPDARPDSVAVQVPAQSPS
ncbi:SDR family NAD(P)-dependent oxidoreductase [Haliangium ochraceum]|uniref:Short-chain dehydrogenase/reductase SDR n=1 Tax=Haliangium ochraceum (strain DSM 14365 / JCM 11303 / SMP-2) TaxID=502025 RepID=D0LYJ9_HALO1|nr:SDR family NAD(P)-dependent oxidoreductase [Haliangium ochraceum]ACY17865.1 short-chain dehydrogenase/reductase SDR [Haliangium ochraceum DSM 14365]